MTSKNTKNFPSHSQSTVHTPLYEIRVLFRFDTEKDALAAENSFIKNAPVNHFGVSADVSQHPPYYRKSWVLLLVADAHPQEASDFMRVHGKHWASFFGNFEAVYERPHTQDLETDWARAKIPTQFSKIDYKSV